MSKKSINFFTCCDESYEDFLPLFCLSILKYVPESVIEICVPNRQKTLDTHKQALKYLKKVSGNRILIREVSFTDAAKARFTTPVKSKTPYIYITDIDIITLSRKVVEAHLAEMEKTRLPYSNAVRPGTKRLTGLHFTKYEAYYPIQRDTLNWQVSDEEMLYEIIDKRGLRMPEHYFRPIFGIHISPNRYAIGEPGWEIAKYANEWKRFRESKEFKGIYGFLSGRVKNCILLIDLIINENLF